MEVIVLLVMLFCTVGPCVSKDSDRVPSPNDVERILMVKMNESDVFPCVSAARTASVRKTSGKRREHEEMKGFWEGPSMCSKCVACAALVFGLLEEFSKRESSKLRDDVLNVVCDVRMPMYRIWDVGGIRYFGEPTVNARHVLKHESLVPSVQYVCRTMKNMTTGQELYNLWSQDRLKFMNRLCFNAYFHPGLASCRGLLKQTKGIDRMKVCRKPIWAYVLERIFSWNQISYKYCEEQEYRKLLSWYTLGNHDYNE
ncbi:hypothetical protein GE061_008289 [Apolygus lucorum]|uniref:Uncharacterized protein n=1 Tax=Apolygus lucorum TaxID=248454 RepID=A0A6A4J0S6_APOLU|nr:hypothetical protein GE061_008289 [Apolygus lucorum]